MYACIISHRADVAWPPRRCDLTLFGLLVDALKDNIHEATGEIQLHTIHDVLINWTDCVGATAWPVIKIIFHYQPKRLYFQIKARNLRKYSIHT